MKARRMKFHVGAVATALLCVPIALAVAPAVAEAQTSNPVSGTVYEGGAWYRSSTVRHVTTSNDSMYLTLTQTPSQGIKWYLNSTTNGAKFGSQVTLNSPGTGTLATGVLNGTSFQNNYAQNSTCNFNCGSYNFSGSEIY